MSDVVVTATSVARVTGNADPNLNTSIDNGFAGATITAGQTVYKDANGVYQLADSNLSATTAATTGIALNGAASGQPVAVAIGGSLTGGFTAAVGTIYVQSANAGGIAPAADLVSGWRTTIIGVGLTASTISLLFHRSGVAVP